jgi:hypothetical protein
MMLTRQQSNSVSVPGRASGSRLNTYPVAVQAMEADFVRANSGCAMRRPSAFAQAARRRGTDAAAAARRGSPGTGEQSGGARVAVAVRRRRA